MKAVKLNGGICFYEDHVLPECYADRAVSADTLPERPSKYSTLDVVDGALAWVDTLSPAELREQAYNVEKVISWGGEMLTVTEAATLWNYYAAEGSDKAAELQTLIAAAKAEIRTQYPDGEGE